MGYQISGGGGRGGKGIYTLSFEGIFISCSGRRKSQKKNNKRYGCESMSHTSNLYM